MLQSTIDKEMANLNLKSIQSRTSQLRDVIIKTPMINLHSPYLNKELSAKNIFLKLECFQHTGTFKARGAISVSSSISLENQKKGFTAASAGNHAIAAAWAARKMGTSAKVVMRSTANPYRIARVKEEMAEIKIVHDVKELFEEAEKLVKEEKRTFIHPFEGINTTLGTAGVGLEFIEEVPKLDLVIVSVGGGGLISGVASSIKLINSNCQVVGVEPLGANSMYTSFKKGKPIQNANTDTLVDSLAPPMTLPFSFNVCKKFVDKIVLVSDDEICASMVILQEEAKLAIEPAAAACLAAILGPLKEMVQGKNVGLVMCGANIDSQSYSKLLRQGRDYKINNQ